MNRPLTSAIAVGLVRWRSEGLRGESVFGFVHAFHREKMGQGGSANDLDRDVHTLLQDCKRQQHAKRCTSYVHLRSTPSLPCLWHDSCVRFIHEDGRCPDISCVNNQSACSKISLHTISDFRAATEYCLCLCVRPCYRPAPEPVWLSKARIGVCLQPRVHNHTPHTSILLSSFHSASLE